MRTIFSIAATRRRAISKSAAASKATNASIRTTISSGATMATASTARTGTAVAIPNRIASGTPPLAPIQSVSVRSNPLTRSSQHERVFRTATSAGRRRCPAAVADFDDAGRLCAIRRRRDRGACLGGPAEHTAARTDRADRADHRVREARRSCRNLAAVALPLAHPHVLVLGAVERRGVAGRGDADRHTDRHRYLDRDHDLGPVPLDTRLPAVQRKQAGTGDVSGCRQRAARAASWPWSYTHCTSRSSGACARNALRWLTKQTTTKRRPAASNTYPAIARTPSSVPVFKNA